VDTHTTAPISSLSSISEDSDDSVNTSKCSTSTGPSVTPRSKSGGKGKGKGKGKKSLPPVPTTLTQARLLLNTQAHVNIVDLMQAQQNWKKAVKGNKHQSLAHLAHPSIKALVRYTMEEEKFIKRKTAKNEWLQPLLRGIVTNCRYR
jgi:hypothetical protein